jgi:hypothetical protein
VSLRWRKLGLAVHPAKGGPDPFGSHAMVPFRREGELCYSVRDAQGRSHTVAARWHPEAAPIPAEEGRPLLAPGPLGAFDDAGAMGSCAVAADDGSEHLYYIGWSLGVSVPFVTSIGCARSTDGGRTFERASAAPVIGRNRFDPFLATSPWVIRDGGRWRMWYTSATRWESTPAGPKHHYNIRHAESDDGIEWRVDGTVCVNFASADEYALARPCVVRDRDTYRMWFSRRGEAYRIGYAESSDGIAWERRDAEAGIDVSADGFDAESQEYPHVFHDGHDWRLLYNGADYGRTGIGHAVAEGAA